MACEATRSAARRGGVGLLTVSLLVVCALALGLVLGGALFGGFEGSTSSVKAALSERQLDDVAATYVVSGKKHQVTFRDAIMENGSLEAAKKSDGTYRVPSAESILAVARGQIITAEAEKQGIQVGDTEVDAYAMATFGTTDRATIATAYGMERDAAEVLLREAALMSALRDQVMAAEVGYAPAVPPEPEEGEEVALLPKYADYILELASGEWDYEAGTWFSYDGPYASALADYEISADGASHEAALQAYYVAYQRHVAAQSERAAQWTDYVNGLLEGSSIEISTLAM